MDRIFYELMHAFHNTWCLHWKSSGPGKIGTHTTLDELYGDLKGFIDEYVEINISRTHDNSIVNTITGFTVTPTIDLATLVSQLETLRGLILDECTESLFDDWKGRLITVLNHHVFILDPNTRSSQLFDSKQNDLVKLLKTRFKDQDEFVTMFHYYINSKLKPSDPNYKFFKDNEQELLKLSSLILETNKKLFALKSELTDQTDTVKKNYNSLVRTFDIFQ